MKSMIKLPGLSLNETFQLIHEDTILLGYVGSISHGTYVPNDDPNSIDDKDIMGVFISGKEDYLGLGNYPESPVKHLDTNYKEWDSISYELHKFVKLLLKQNPNVLGTLWLKSENYIHVSPLAQKLIDNRDIFISKEMYHSFAGYANAQFHKMTHLACEGYMGDKRKKLVMKYGYDVKNAAHLIRLLNMCIEALGDGQLRVFREDNAIYKSIKRGEWKLAKVKEEANSLFRLAKLAYVNSPLQPLPNYQRAQALVMEILEEHFQWKSTAKEHSSSTVMQ